MLACRAPSGLTQPAGCAGGQQARSRGGVPRVASGPWCRVPCPCRPRCPPLSVRGRRPSACRCARQCPCRVHVACRDRRRGPSAAAGARPAAARGSRAPAGLRVVRPAPARALVRVVRDERSPVAAAGARAACRPRHCPWPGPARPPTAQHRAAIRVSRNRARSPCSPARVGGRRRRRQQWPGSPIPGRESIHRRAGRGTCTRRWRHVAIRTHTRYKTQTRGPVRGALRRHALIRTSARDKT